MLWGGGLTSTISSKWQSCGFQLKPAFTVCCFYTLKHITPLLCVRPVSLSLYRSKVLCRWLASLPVQLSQLGHRNPALSAQIIASIQTAASRGHKDLLASLQTCACTIYGMNSGYLMACLLSGFKSFAMSFIFFLGIDTCLTPSYTDFVFFF